MPTFFVNDDAVTPGWVCPTASLGKAWVQADYHREAFARALGWLDIPSFSLNLSERTKAVFDDVDAIGVIAINAQAAHNAASYSDEQSALYRNITFAHIDAASPRVQVIFRKVIVDLMALVPTIEPCPDFDALKATVRANVIPNDIDEPYDEDMSIFLPNINNQNRS